ncbi:MAG: hypothetical protein QOG80_2419, partial [Pseudonocardiales bacterium]|nr:hypothetical protein [Pseudonocardiales bacterium]
MPTLRVLSYNIRSLRDDGSAVARVIADTRPDVVCVQEAPRFLLWRTRCRWLARTTGLVIAAGGRDAAANLLLVHPGVTVAAARSVLFTKDPRIHQRGAAMALLHVGESPVVIAGTHLDGYPAPRLRHVGELFAAIDDFAPSGVGVVLAGDFNDDPGTPVWNALLQRGADAFAVAGTGDGLTLNVSDPTRRIDAIFAGDGITVRAARSLDSDDVR